MSVMLAVRRSGVTVTLHTLEGAGAIRNDRAVVTVLDRARLEDIAGPSYGAPEAEARRLLGLTAGIGGKGRPRRSVAPTERAQSVRVGGAGKRCGTATPSRSVDPPMSSVCASNVSYCSASRRCTTSTAGSHDRSAAARSSTRRRWKHD